jgi:hypothetical protein
VPLLVTRKHSIFSGRLEDHSIIRDQSNGREPTPIMLERV